MFRSVIWLGVAMCVTVFAGPLAVLAAQTGKADPRDLYIVLDAGASPLSENKLAVFGARDIGPTRGVIAKVIHAPGTAHAQLVQGGYFVLPAGVLAAICGIGPDQNDPTPRKS